MVKHYVEYYYTKGPVKILSEPIEERDDAMVKLPKGVSGYRFYDIKEETLSDKTTREEPYNISGYTFYGTEFTLKEIQKRLSRRSPLVKFMKKCGYKRAVVTPDETIICLEERDRVLSI